MKVQGYEVPQVVFDALCYRLDKGPAAARQLVAVAILAGAPERDYIAHRVVDRWLTMQRKANRIEYNGSRWSIKAAAHG